MKEPNLKALLELLNEMGAAVNRDGDTSIADEFFDKSRSSEKDVEQLLYYCKKEMAATVVNEIGSNSNDEKKNNITSALVKLYPISQYIVLEMLRVAYTEPAKFVKLYDFDSRLVDSIKENLKSIKNKSRITNVDFLSYEQNVQRVEENIEELRTNWDELKKSIDGYEQKQSEKEELEEEIANLRKIIDEGGIDKEIERKKNELTRLQTEKRNKDDEKKTLSKEIGKLQNYLKEKDKNDNTGDKEYKDALRALEKCVKAIEKK